jgi:hypothetical protein
VFVNPKTYGILYKKNNKEIIRMKGYNNDQIKFSQLKEKFYAEEIIRIEDFLYLKKSNFYLENVIIEKIFDLDNYDKRVFIENKRNTKPLFYKNFIYF